MNYKLAIVVALAFSLIIKHVPALAQQTGLVVNLAPIDGLDLSPDNIFNYRIESALPGAVNTKVKGTVRFRNSPLFFSYEYTLTIFPGSNSINPHLVRPVWHFSSSALRELFLNYKRLPQGTYEYCVSASPASAGSETPVDVALSECLYQQSDDIFLINLIDPDNNAKIREFNPVLSWVVNYPFASELTYRLRIAEIKDGQNTVSAITRNNPVYQENNLRQTSQGYPVYARPLVLWQPYAWTVDAYYKDILLGGAEPWRFTIVEDTLEEVLPTESSYIDINADNGSNRYYVVGQMKLKYAESDFLQNELKIKILRGDKAISKQEIIWPINRGDNFNVYDLTDMDIKHKEELDVVIEFKHVKSIPSQQVIKFKYVNPSLAK